VPQRDDADIHILTACVVLRLDPPVSGIIRQCARQTTLPVGGGPDGKKPIAIMPGDTVRVSVAGMHRDPEIFGSDANEFRPERWADDKLRPIWEYLPFGGGPRVCPAQQLALFWATYALARLVMTFERLENAEQDEEKANRMRFQSRINHGLNVILVPVQ
jgi:cytochrome P450